MKKGKSYLYCQIKALSNELKNADPEDAYTFYFSAVNVRLLKKYVEEYIAIGGKRDLSKLVEM